MPKKADATKTLGNRLHSDFDEEVKGNGKKVNAAIQTRPKRIIPVTDHEQDKADQAKTKQHNRKDYPAYADDALVKLVNLIFDPMSVSLLEDCGIDPDEAHLLGLTRINSSKEAWMWAQQITKEAAFNKYVNGIKPKMSLTQIRRVAFLFARRSIPGDCGPGFMLGVGLAQEQNITKSEEDVEGQDW
jgi:hypothetical protein